MLVNLSIKMFYVHDNNLALKKLRYVLKCLLDTDVFLLSIANNYPVDIKPQQRTAKKKKKKKCLFHCCVDFWLCVCLNLRIFQIFGQPPHIIHRLSSFWMVGLVTTKFLSSEKNWNFLLFGTIFSDGGSILYQQIFSSQIIQKQAL